MEALDLLRPRARGETRPLFLIAGPCAIEDPVRGAGFTLRIAAELVRMTERLEIPLIFKASYDKANRTSLESYRGPGLEEGLEILAQVRREAGCPVLSDVHETAQVGPAAAVLDVIQIPAFLCRQTDLVMAAARAAKALNLKKGQFLAPWDMRWVLAKARAAGGTDRIALTERGTSFGYGRLVVDMAGLGALASLGAPVVFDATHSAQEPGGRGGASGGRREAVPLLVRAAVAAGVDGLFLEVHPDPDRALSDGPNMWPLERLEALLARALRIREALS